MRWGLCDVSTPSLCFRSRIDAPFLAFLPVSRVFALDLVAVLGISSEDEVDFLTGLDSVAFALEVVLAAALAILTGDEDA